MFLKPVGWRMRRLKYGIVFLVLMLVAVIVVNVPYAAHLVFAIAFVAAAVWIVRRKQREEG